MEVGLRLAILNHAVHRRRSSIYISLYAIYIYAIYAIYIDRYIDRHTHLKVRLRLAVLDDVVQRRRRSIYRPLYVI